CCRQDPAHKSGTIILHYHLCQLQILALLFSATLPIVPKGCDKQKFSSIDPKVEKF
ncbi:unnamed protein product, partial [Lepidochelys kempii]